MPRRGRGRGRTVACRNCGKPIAVFGSPFRNGRWTTFERRPVDPRTRAQADGADRNVFPVWMRKAYRPDALIAELQSLTGGSVDDAHQEVQDLPWHRLHRCLVLGAIAEKGGA